MMINKYNGVANTPRAHITNQRTMEVLRDLGLERQAKAASTPQHLMGDHVYATSLAGKELGRIRTWYTHPNFKAEHDLASPTAVCDIPQDAMEPILVNAASYRGTTVRNGTELLRFEQDADGVTSWLLDRVTGEEYTVRSRYLIGADGGRSRVAEQLDLAFEGEMAPSASMNVVFRADLSHLVEHRPSDMYWFLQQGVGHGGVGVGVLRVVDTWDRWVGVWGFDASQGTPELTDELGVSIAHKLIGDDTVPVEIESLSTWGVNPRGTLGREHSWPGVHRRGCRAPPLADERPRIEHLHPGLLQPGVEARSRVAGSRGARAARELRPGASAHRQAPRGSYRAERRADARPVQGASSASGLLGAGAGPGAREPRSAE